ncbi:helix-turn-helix domain-containing protein [Patescibacteria group bacterium]|nr:helix-turn-helix domain-containing protein [Patescibacteria group bacterium]
MLFDIYFITLDIKSMGSFTTRKIRGSKTLGQRLEVARRRKKFTYDEVEEATKIRARYLKAIEDDNYRALPGPVYLTGFLRSYAEFLGLPVGEVLKQYKMERSMAVPSAKNKSFRPTGTVKELGFAITPKTIVVIAVSLVVLGLFSYVGWQVKRFSSPPPIILVAPEGDTVREDSVVVRGQTTETAKLQINGQEISVDAEGYFSQKVGLKRGVNTIEIRAQNRIGKENIKVLKIFADFEASPNPTNN